MLILRRSSTIGRTYPRLQKSTFSNTAARNPHTKTGPEAHASGPLLTGFLDGRLPLRTFCLPLVLSECECNAFTPQLFTLHCIHSSLAQLDAARPESLHYLGRWPPQAIGSGHCPAGAGITSSAGISRIHYRGEQDARTAVRLVRAYRVSNTEESRMPGLRYPSPLSPHA